MRGILGGYTKKEVLAAMETANQTFYEKLRRVRVEVQGDYKGNINKVLLTQSGFIDRICEALGWDKIYENEK